MMIRILKLFLNFKIILAAIFFALIVFSVLVVLLWSSRGNMGLQIPATAMLSVIKAPTETPIAPVFTPTPITTPTPTQQEPVQGGNIAIGNYVQVSGTGGEGLRLHQNASISSDVRYIAIEAEVFVVKDGPVDADGYTWWLLQDPYSEDAAGWGAANYLVVVQNPASN
jgi:hypothetical protein